MNKEALEVFSREAAKGIKIERELNEFRQMLTKVTVEHVLNSELDDPLGTINTNPQAILIAVTALPVRLCVPKRGNFNSTHRCRLWTRLSMSVYDYPPVRITSLKTTLLGGIASSCNPPEN